jgi:hypothetical protein
LLAHDLETEALGRTGCDVAYSTDNFPMPGALHNDLARTFAVDFSGREKNWPVPRHINLAAA